MRYAIIRADIHSDVCLNDQPPRTAIEVICEQNEPQPTGLLDADGNKLYRMPAYRPPGFHTKWDGSND